MKKFIAGLVIGILLTSAGIGLASQDVIRIFIDGQEVVPDVPPQIIDGRVMVPARFIAEPLGATVEWDGENRSVIIKGQSEDREPNIEGMLTPRDIINKYGEQFNITTGADGWVYKDGKPLFNWRNEGIVINGRTYVPASVVENYLLN